MSCPLPASPGPSRRARPGASPPGVGLGTPGGRWVAPRGRGRAPFCASADAGFQPVMSSVGIASRETSPGVWGVGEVEEAKPPRNAGGAAPVRGYLHPPPRAARSTQWVAPRRGKALREAAGRPPDTKGGSSELGSRAGPSLGLPSAVLMGIAGGRRGCCSGGPQPSRACGCRGVCFAAPGEKEKVLALLRFLPELFVISGSKNPFLIGHCCLSRPSVFHLAPPVLLAYRSRTNTNAWLPTAWCAPCNPRKRIFRQGKSLLSNISFVHKATNAAGFGTSPEATFNSLLET